MAHTCETQPTGTGLADTSLLGSLDTRENAKNSSPVQDISRNSAAVREAKLCLLREAVGEQAGFIQIHADLVQTFAFIGDDAGIAYALKRLVAHAKVAARTANDLAALKMEGWQ